MDVSSASARCGPTTAAVGPALAILHEQHGRIRDLLEQVTISSGVDRRDAFDGLRELLAAHESAEELVLRPAGRRAASAAVVAARDGEERQIAGMLADLERLDVDCHAFDAGFAKFAEALSMHTWLEEAEEFPALQEHWSEHRQELLAAWIRRALTLGPTHAHPLVAGSTVAQWTVGPFAALLDRARDHLAGSREEREARSEPAERRATEAPDSGRGHRAVRQTEQRERERGEHREGAS